MKHTPGPWKWADKYTDKLIGDDGKTVINSADYEGMYFCGENEEGNACLIAAAPELLYALKGLLAEYEFDEANPGRRKSFIAARLAIAKAEGV
jgi:hypothetical protein